MGESGAAIDFAPFQEREGRDDLRVDDAALRGALLAEVVHLGAVESDPSLALNGGGPAKAARSASGEPFRIEFWNFTR